MDLISFEEACRQYPNRYTMEHVPEWATVAAPNGKFYAPQFASDLEWYKYTIFPTEAEICLGSESRHFSWNHSWPLGKWLDKPYSLRKKIIIGVHQITQCEWSQYCVETGHPIPREWNYMDYPNAPMVKVTAHQAEAYCRHRNGRLPTESEWTSLRNNMSSVMLWDWTSTEDGPERRIVQGGAWNHQPALGIVAVKNTFHVDSRHSGIGFRCLWEV